MVPLRRPTDDTPALTNAAAVGMRRKCQPGYDFIKAWVMLLELQPTSVVQHELVLEPTEDEEPTRDRSRLTAIIVWLTDGKPLSPAEIDQLGMNRRSAYLDENAPMEVNT